MIIKKKDILLRKQSNEIHFISNGESRSNSMYKFDRSWSKGLWILTVSVLLIMAMRVFDISMRDHEKYFGTASGNTLRENITSATRGKIYDKNGIILADNEPNYSLIMRYKERRSLTELSPTSRNNLFKKIAKKFDIPLEEIEQKYKAQGKERRDTIIKDNVSSKKVIAYKASEEKNKAIEITQNASRIYPQGPLFAHIIGYEGLIDHKTLKQKRIESENGGALYLLNDRIGKTGLEQSYESDLHGTHGSVQNVVNSTEEIIKQVTKINPIHGRDLHTYIDAQLQEKLTQELEASLKKAGSDRGAAVAIDPQTGGVMALVSLPTYDNNAFVHGISSDLYTHWVNADDKPLFNRAIAGTYPPGSTIKPMLGAAVLAEGVIGERDKIESKGGIQVGSHFFGDWKIHGFTDIREAIAVSSDVYFYTVSGGYGNRQGLGIDLMDAWMRRFGFGKKTGIDLQSEANGTYPNPEIKKELVGERWYTGDTYNTSIGQGFFTATPLQIASATAVVANGGTLYKPQIVSHIGNDERDGRSNIISEGIAPTNILKTVREGMRMTVTEGTARMMQAVPVPVAGKTGTAQFFGNDEKLHSWFTAYAPVDNPEIVVTILVEGQDASISTSTVPVAKDVLSWYFSEYDSTTNTR